MLIKRIDIQTALSTGGIKTVENLDPHHILPDWELELLGEPRQIVVNRNTGQVIGLLQDKTLLTPGSAHQALTLDLMVFRFGLEESTSALLSAPVTDPRREEHLQNAMNFAAMLVHTHEDIAALLAGPSIAPRRAEQDAASDDDDDDDEERYCDCGCGDVVSDDEGEFFPIFTPGDLPVFYEQLVTAVEFYTDYADQLEFSDRQEEYLYALGQASAYKSLLRSFEQVGVQ